MVSLLRDFSAPVKVKFAQTDDELAHLIKFDDNGFTRWEAMQQLSLNLLLPLIQAESTELDLAADSPAYARLLAALRALLESAPEDKAILAEMLILPATSYIAEQCKPIDPQRVVSVKQAVEARLASDLADTLFAIYAENNQRQTFSLSAAAMAERELKNTVLSLLVCTDSAQYHELALQQYYAANNMTDRIAAFRALLHSGYQNKQEVIAHFYDQWQDDALVLDKWFAVQATTPQADVLSSVMSLMNHSAFSIKNPNKVRSLVGAFTSNLRAFHRADGAGYQLLADIIIQLNTINPQIAARLAATFNNWKAYSEPYASNMQSQLRRISQQPELSKDIAEIVSKALV